MTAPSPSVRNGECIETFSGRQFWVMDPQPQDVCIEDIAHALSMFCRYNGHIRHFYSVAQHSLNVCRDLMARGHGERLALIGLLHDSSEAYFGDLPSPVKRHFPAYKEIENKLEPIIFNGLGITPPTAAEWAIMKESDVELLQHEASTLMPNKTGWAKPTRPFPTLDLEEKNPKVIEDEFLAAYRILKTKI